MEILSSRRDKADLSSLHNGTLFARYAERGDNDDINKDELMTREARYLAILPS